MRMGRAIGLEEIPMEFWKSKGMERLTELFKIFLRRLKCLENGGGVQ